MNNVRQIALNCTAKKISYRQSKDGIVVSFLIHHAEMPDKLAIADLGTPYMLALVEIDENDKLVPQQPAKEQPAPSAELLAGRAVAGRVAAVQLAGILCNEVRFQTFMHERYLGLWRLTNYGLTDAERCSETVRKKLGVISRAEIKTDDNAYARWQELDAQYQAWLRE